MRKFTFLFIFILSFAAHAGGLITPPGRNETLSFKARTHTPYDASVTYQEPYLNGNSKAFPLAAEGKRPKSVDYDRICELLGHTQYLNVEPQMLEEDDELFWIEAHVMFPKFHDQIIYLLTCI